jgi:WD40 repeat protein
MRKSSVVLAAVAVLPALCLAVSTRSWLSSTYSDFEKGELKGVSVRSDGRITLAPASHELFDSTLAYLWSIAADSHGVIYAGGGPGASVYRFAQGRTEKVAEFDAVEIHALAIDRQDRVYAATFPDGQIYRLTPGAKPEPIYNPHQKYIWAMTFSPAGDLFVATGDHGEIHRVSPDRKASVFFHTEDTHVRTLAFSGPDLIAGTDPTGLVFRIDPQAHGFVLYQLPKREVTAVSVAPDGAIYAAGAGTQQTAGSTSALLAAIAAPATANPPPAQSGATPAAPRTIALTGGSELYRIEKSGLPQKVWSHPQDVIYAIAFDAAGLPILGTGNKGTVYRVDSPSLYTALEIVNVNQITALLPGPRGSFLAAAGNLGKVFQFGPALEPRGEVSSEVFDSGSFSAWGKLTPYGDRLHATLKLEARSGNLDRPRNYWSPWSATAPPPARFVQWRATLTATAAATPVLDSVELAYLPRNVAPRIDEIDSTPPNYKFPAPVLPVLLQRAPSTINLPAMGKRATAGNSLNLDSDSSTMTAAKGWIGLRWTATDDNSDPLLYTLQIRGVHESQWKPLHEKLVERHFTFDSTSYADGEYRVRVIASDQPGNPGGAALTGQLDSSPILIDNTPPVISGLTAALSNGSTLRVTWKAADALSVIRRAEYSLDGGDWILVDPVTGLSDSQALDYAHDIPALTPGEHTIAVRVTDDYDNAGIAKAVTR